MEIDTIFRSRFLDPKSLDGFHDFTITTVAAETIATGENRIVLGVKETDKLLPINERSARQLARLLGSTDTKDWIGRAISVGEDRPAKEIVRDSKGNMQAIVG